MKMKLHYSPASPFARKVRVFALETGLDRDIEPHAITVSPVNPNSELASDNPLMKVPTLITADGTALFDSRVICEYLDALHSGRKLFPANGPARWRSAFGAARQDRRGPCGARARGSVARGRAHHRELDGGLRAKLLGLSATGNEVARQRPRPRAVVRKAIRATVVPCDRATGLSTTRRSV